MNDTDLKICPDCGQRAYGNVISHEVFCCDIYVVSAPNATLKQQQIDIKMTEKIVKPLEQRGYKCYLGYRDIPWGDVVIEAFSYPITIVPTTIMPVYKDRNFSAIRNFLLRPDYLNRVVFVCFDQTPVEPPAVAKNCFSINIDNPYLLSKLEKTIQTKCLQIPLCDRKRKFEMSKIKSDPELSVSSTTSDFQRNTVFRRSESSRVSFRIRTPVSVISEVSRSFEDISAESTKKLTSPEELLSCCNNVNENVRNCAAKRLRKLIQENLVEFSNDDHLHLQTFEKQTRRLTEKYDSVLYMKLYFWILVAIFFRIYKCNDLDLRRYIRILTLTKCKISKDSFNRLCQQVYLNLIASLHAKMKAWPKSLDSNKLYIKKFEKCLEMINVSLIDSERTTPEALIKKLLNLPWDMKHIFIVAIADKQFKKNHITSSVNLLSEIFDILERKHWGVFLDVLEMITEYTLEDYTEDSLNACMSILHSILTWNLQRRWRKNHQLNTVLKHFMSKLVYHPVRFVRCFVTPLMLGKDFVSFEVSKLGNRNIKVDKALVEMCIRAHMHHKCPDMVLNDKAPTDSFHTSVYEAKTPEGDALVCVFKQRTLNDLLQTNYTDDAYERFREMSRLVQVCQKHKNIVTQRNVAENGVLPFFVVETGKPLLQFLHEKENQLTWFQMIQILIDITTAVHHCHSKTIILCDITPASFIVVDDGSLKIKLASFLHARSGEQEDSSSTSDDYIFDSNALCIQGDKKEPVAAYFSSPESLTTKQFSKYTDVWMLAATFYSVLLYGRRPFEELAHLNIYDLVKEIISEHTASKPISIPPDLWNILQTNLNFCARNRKLNEVILQDLETYQKDLGARGHTTYTVITVSNFINPEEIQRGYVDDTRNFVLEEREELFADDSEDGVRREANHLIQTVTVRMSLQTRRKLLQLDHENILGVNEIKTDCYKTILVSNPFIGHVHALSETKRRIPRGQLYSYFKQITLGLQELHNNNIVLCDLRCSSIYINPHEGTLKIGHVGRAVSLDGISTFPYAIKLMPPDAAKWSAPEVREKSSYSKASDIFNLAAVFFEAKTLHINTIYQNQPVESFQHGKTHLEEYYQFVSGQCLSEDPVNKLERCILECWNPNPTKRPTLDKMLNVINDIITHNASCSSTEDTEDLVYLEGSEEDVYTTVLESDSSCGSIDFSSSALYNWNEVVEEFALTRGVPNITKPFIELKETSTYNDIGIPLRNKAH
ncbi:uncharacterized protein [Dendropsophus ebraccatus]|uniref:uncharacterized protein isoform X2 n=1 Tax=Dendropsophus ebraccatus TaxID=150705 RepID=UPI0038320AAF